jgi:hypothetical protein
MFRRSLCFFLGIAAVAVWLSVTADVRAAEPKTAVKVSVDTSEVPDLAAWADKAKALVEKWHPLIAEMLKSDGFTPPTEVKLIFKKDMKGVAGTSGATIRIAANYVSKHPDDWGMVVHELVHVIQSYPPNDCGWLVEGIADYVRYYHFEPKPKFSPVDPKASYRDAYKTTAKFLAWVEEKHDKAIVVKLNRAIREKKYKDDLFKEHTTKTLDQLWSDYVAFTRGEAPSGSDWRSRRRAELAELPKPQPPAGNGSEIDRFLAAHWAKQKFTAPAAVADRVFARRVYFDIIGLPPTVEQLEKFEKDAAADKRAKLIDALLNDNAAYAEHWMTFWNDLLRNDEQTNIDGLRKPITQWLYTSLKENKPLDLFVAELLNPGKDGPDGYLKGVNWRGRVNASQLPPIQAAQNVSQVFLASSLKCASCHDSFINHWKLEQAYGLASFFATQDLEMHRCDAPTGKRIGAKFLFPDLGNVPDKADLATRHRTIAEVVTRPKNPRFARTIVNRLWKRLLGRGLFEPVDDFDGAPVHAELLDWLAYDFMSHDYDAKHTLRLILNSRVYQLPVAKPQAAKGKEAPPILGPVERRLTSEQYLDAIAQVTGYWPKTAVMNVKVENPLIRTWRHKKPDAVTTALGRPNREQVCTVRDEESTVLQALELVNGQALSDRLKQGARTLLASELGKETDATKVVRALYLRAVGRPPTDSELSLAAPLVRLPTDKTRQEGWEDLLWVLFQSTEFQFVR